MRPLLFGTVHFRQDLWVRLEAPERWLLDLILRHLVCPAVPAVLLQPYLALSSRSRAVSRFSPRGAPACVHGALPQNENQFLGLGPFSIPTSLQTPEVGVEATLNAHRHAHSGCSDR